MANSGIYEGGVVEGNPDFTLPAQDGGATQFQPAPGAGGAGRINPTNGGAPEMNGSYKDDFMDQDDYRGNSDVMFPQNFGSPKVANPDNLSKSPTGGAKGLGY